MQQKSQKRIQDPLAEVVIVYFISSSLEDNFIQSDVFYLCDPKSL